MRLALLLALLAAVPAVQGLVPLPELPVLGPYQLVCPMTSPLERCNTRLSVEEGPANEVMVAGNPLDRDEFLAVAKDYHDAAPGAPSCVGTSFYHTVDGGRTWREGLVAAPGVPCESDPVAAFDRNGVAWVNTLRISPRELVNYRPDGAGWREVGRSIGYDKQWIASNPVTGTLYVTDALNRFQRSTDGGATWSTSATGIGGFAKQISAAPDGRVVVTGVGGGGLISYVSTNDGLTFSGPHTVASVSFPSTGNGLGLGLYNERPFRTPQTFTMAVDQGDTATRGRFWVAFPGVVSGSPFAPMASRFGVGAWDIWLSHSDDGVAWSAPVRVNDDVAPSAQFFPAVAVSTDGVAHVAWMDQRLDPSGQNVDVYYANTASPVPLNVRITDQPFLSLNSYHQSGFVFVGDYIGVAASEDRAVVTWPDTRNGRSEVFAAVLERA